VKEPRVPFHTALRLLLVEDSEDDAFFILKELRRGGYEVLSQRVETPEAFVRALDEGGWDAIICDYVMPTFDASKALELTKEKGFDVPFIIVYGLVSEEKVVEAMRLGAHDYVNKGNLTRLVPAIERELREARVRREFSSVEGKLRESEERFRATFEQATVGIGHIAPDGRWLMVNTKLCEIVGYSREAMLGFTFEEIIHPEDLANDLVHAHRLLDGETETYFTEKRYVRKDGSIVWVELTVSLMCEPSGEPWYFIAVIEDISERKRTEAALRQNEELYRTVVDQAAENIFLIDVETKRILEANDRLHRSLGYTTEEFRQLTLYDIVAHDRESVDRNIRRIMEGGRTFLGERKYQSKDGRLVNVEVSVNAISYKGREVMCIVAYDVTERKRTEGMLRQTLDGLLALYEAGHVLGSSLDSEEVGSRLLKIMQRISSLTTAVISTPDEHGRLRVWRAVGVERLWERVRYTSEVQDTLKEVLEAGEHRTFRLRRPGEEGETLAGLCLPLRIRNRVIGLLEAYGPEALLKEDTVEVLSGMTSQAASALENARLYGELAEREKRLQELLGKTLEAQEEERRRVAYEVHDGLAQVAVAAHQRLQAFARRYPPDSEKGREALDRILRLVRQTVGDSRRVIADLRPTALDDFGLSVALRQEVEELRDAGWRVEYEDKTGDQRLPTSAEVALFRVAQEAMTNARKHAQTRRLRLTLRSQEGTVNLEVRDWGRGFDSASLQNRNGPGERIGLSGMRERVGLLGGEFEVRSRPGEGTSVKARVPLSVLADNEQKEERDGR
jgi:PAS domain S-box-containing protein